MIVTGFGFYPGMVVRWNGADRPTTFLNGEQFRVEISAKDIAKGGIAQVYAYEPLIFEQSNSISFTIHNPVPVLTSLAPTSVQAGTGAFELVVTGTNFVESSSIRWDGEAKATRFVSASELRAMLNGDEAAQPGTAVVDVLTPEPGGGLSQRVSFTTLVPALSIYFPRLVTAPAEHTGLAVVNLDDGSASITLTALDARGTRIAGAAITNPRSLTLGRGEQLARVDTELFGEQSAGSDSAAWIRLQSSVRKVAGFFLMFDDRVGVLDGVDVSSTRLSTLLFPEIEELGYTRFHAANPSAQAATVDFELVSETGIVRGGAATRTIPPGGALSESFADLFPGVVPLASDYVRATSSVGIAALEVLGKTGEYVEALNGQSQAAAAATLYSPQYAVGPNWRTALSVVNLEGKAGNVTFRLFGDDGVQIGQTRRLPVAAAGKVRVDTPGFFRSDSGELIQGYVLVESDVRVSGSVVFGDPARRVFSTALPLVAVPLSDIVFSQLASDDTYFTGLAVLNPGDEVTAVTIEVYDAAGAVIARKNEILGARARRSQLLTEFFPALAVEKRSSGYIRLKADRAVASFALFGTRDLSALAAIPPQRVPE